MSVAEPRKIVPLSQMLDGEHIALAILDLSSSSP
jgi:hypothetical protein